MPMGLKNVQSFVQRIMEDVLSTGHPELCSFVTMYIDAITIATQGDGPTEEELVALHEKQLNQVMDILDVNQVICGPKKENFFLKTWEFFWSSSREWCTPSWSRESGCYSEVEAP